MNFSGLHTTVYSNAVWAEIVYKMLDLIFFHFYFVILFCQNKVKKNCKSATRVFFKNNDIRH